MHLQQSLRKQSLWNPRPLGEASSVSLAIVNNVLTLEGTHPSNVFLFQIHIFPEYVT